MIDGDHLILSLHKAGRPVKPWLVLHARWHKREHWPLFQDGSGDQHVWMPDEACCWPSAWTSWSCEHLNNRGAGRLCITAASCYTVCALGSVGLAILSSLSRSNLSLTDTCCLLRMVSTTPPTWRRMCTQTLS